MREYIEKDKLLNDIECIDISDCTDIDDIFTEIEKTIDEQPTAEVAEVVRCRDCKYWHQKTGYCLKHSYFKDSDGMSCSPADSPDFTFFNEDDFCSYGARKEVDTE